MPEDLNQLSNKRIVLVTNLENKFNAIYKNYFSQKNQVDLIIQENTKDFLSRIKDADIVWSMWCNEPMVYLTQHDISPLLITYIRSYEILNAGYMEKIKWQRVHGAIFVAEHIRGIANRIWSNQLAKISQTTIYNCVELEKYPVYQNGHGKNIAYIGYINHKKGVGLLLQCLAAAIKINPDYKLHIAGTFQDVRFQVYMLHLLDEMRLTNHIVFHGWVKNIPAFLKDMNYVISTSPWEGCPNNMIETMACGIMPIIHNWPGAKMLFPQELVFNTVSEFTDILRKKGYNAMEHRDWVSQNFNALTQVKKIENFIKIMLQKKEATPCQ